MREVSLICLHNAGKFEIGLHAGELGLLEESLLKLCLEYSESLEEAVLSERREESESLLCSSLRGILIHFSCYSKQDLERQIHFP